MTYVGRKFEQNGRSWELVIPREAQVEYASRAGGTGLYFRNEDGQEVTSENLSEYVHTGQNDERGRTARVKEKKPNAWGIHQSTGNVWKWVYAPWTRRLVDGVDPLHLNDDRIGSDHVGRGGGWRDVAVQCGSTRRDWNDPSNRWYYYGVVLALCPSEF